MSSKYMQEDGLHPLVIDYRKKKDREYSKDGDNRDNEVKKDEDYSLDELLDMLTEEELDELIEEIEDIEICRS